MKYTIKIILSVLICALLFTACQATPEKEVVINKNDGKLNETISNISNMPETEYQAPKQVSESFQSDQQNMIINFDANIIVPDGTAHIPVLLVQKADFSQEKADQVLQGLFGTEPLYKVKEYEDMSKKEIEEELIRIKSGEGSDLADFDKAEYDRMVQPEIEALEKRYDSAPENYIPVEMSGDFETYTPIQQGSSPMQGNGVGFEVEAIRATSELRSGNKATIEIFRSSKGASMIVLADRENRQFSPDYGKATDIKKAQNLPDMPFEKVQEIADTLKNDMGFNDFALADVAAIPTGEYSNVETYEELDKCYVLYYMKDWGYPTNYVSNVYGVMGYKPTWPDEVLTFYIDEKGVSEITYVSPSKLVEKEADAVTILPFEDIMEIFRKQVFLSTFVAPQGDEGIVGQQFDVKQAKLGMAKVLVDAENEIYRFLPVWDFYGTWIYKYREGSDDIQGVDKNNEWYEEEFAKSYYTINAIDGSIIDRAIGY